MNPPAPPKVSIQEACIAEALRIEEDAIHSSKSHFNAAVTWDHRNYWIGIPATLFGVSASATIIKSEPLVGGLYSPATTMLNALLTFLKPHEHASKHKTAGE